MKGAKKVGDASQMSNINVQDLVIYKKEPEPQ